MLVDQAADLKVLNEPLFDDVGIRRVNEPIELDDRECSVRPSRDEKDCRVPWRAVDDLAETEK